MQQRIPALRCGSSTVLSISKLVTRSPHCCCGQAYLSHRKNIHTPAATKNYHQTGCNELLCVFAAPVSSAVPTEEKQTELLPFPPAEKNKQTKGSTEEEAGICGWRKWGIKQGRDASYSLGIHRQAKWWCTKANDRKAEIMGRWLRFACLENLWLWVRCTSPSWMCKNYSTEAKVAATYSSCQYWVTATFKLN